MSEEQIASLKSQLELLRVSLNSGELTVKHRDRTVIYRSLSEMRQIEASLLQQIAELQNEGVVSHTSFTMSTDRRL